LLSFATIEFLSSLPELLGSFLIILLFVQDWLVLIIFRDVGLRLVHNHSSIIILGGPHPLFLEQAKSFSLIGGPSLSRDHRVAILFILIVL